MSTAVPPGEFAKALQERRRREQRRRLLGLAAAAAVLVLGGLAIYLLYFSPVLAVKDVSVSGTKLLTVDEVRAAAEVPKGKPLISLDVDGIAARVRELPAVADVSVDRRFPNTVAIAVTERQLVFHRLSGKKYEWVDVSGAVFRTTDSPQAGVPVAVVKAEGADQRLLRDVATVVESLPDGLKPLVKRVDVKAVDQISLALTDGDTVIWGSADESDIKAEVVDALLREVEAKVYDVSAPGYPSTR